MANYTKIPDHELADLLKEGDHAAFTEIYDRYQSLLYVYAYRKLQNRDEAKDIVQEVFVSVWNSRESFQLSTTLSGYLYKAVLYKILSAFRHKTITQQYISSFKQIIEANTSNADYLIREKDISAVIEREINALPEKMREVFELRRKSYLSAREVATQLKISEHTVNTQLYKAIKILKGRLDLLTCLSYLYLSYNLYFSI